LWTFEEGFEVEGGEEDAEEGVARGGEGRGEVIWKRL